ncbi:hypothetical protein RRG08_064730 [Elysia crispata]|uniref:Uncharacterized protein n=1 Tax=Elysia crispata TaxID=231223 RepID=A0AAE0YZI1_9GAST|nr:hypothetical protein RRG08_064730 [Elysia crispata]
MHAQLYSWLNANNIESLLEGKLICVSYDPQNVTPFPVIAVLLANVTTFPNDGQLPGCPPKTCVSVSTVFPRVSIFAVVELLTRIALTRSMCFKDISTNYSNCGPNIFSGHFCVREA